MGGNTPQSISGSGVINVTNFIVADHSNVTLNKDVNADGAVSVYGKLDFTTHQINGAATFASRVNYVSSTGATQAGATLTEGSYQIAVPTNLLLSALQGLSISGTGIAANTNIVSYSSGNGQINLSQPTTVSGTNVTLTFGSGVANLTTSNANGFDDALGSVAVMGNKTYESGTSLIFNAATNTPFSTSTNNLGDVTFNAAATTNGDATIDGTLQLNNSKLTVRTGDNLTMSLTSSFAGASSNSYIVTAANSSTGVVGSLKVNGVASSKLIPIGSANYYLPVTLNPLSTSDFKVNVFEGLTMDATPNGTPLSSGHKADAVNAIWNVKRTSGTGDCNVDFGWQDGLEGSNFAVASSGLGVSKYVSAYGPFLGTANSTTNMASLTDNSDELGSFIIGKNTTLPVKLILFTARIDNHVSVLNWTSTSEVNLDRFVVQRSTDGVVFDNLGSVKANNAIGVFDYSFTDQAPAFGVNYYRLLSVDLDNTTASSDVKAVNFGSIQISVYPNPTQGEVNIVGIGKNDMVKITDLTGRVVRIYENSGENTLKLNLVDINAGLYVITVTNNGKLVHTDRIIKN